MRNRGWSVLVSLAIVMFAGACQGDWAQYGYDGGLTGFNPAETTIGVENVANLREAFRARSFQATGFSMWSSPVVSGGAVYAVDGSNRLVALDAHPGANCTDQLVGCPPLWTGHGFGGSQPASPAVANGVVYTTNTSGPSLVAYDAAGVTNCSGTPKVCEPMWTSSQTNGTWGSPTVVNGRVYVVDLDRLVLEVYDADGVEGCSGVPKTCVALWQGAVGPSYATVAVVGATAYVLDRTGVLTAFDTAIAGCTGATLPRTCAASWSTAPLGPTLAFPAVSNGTVFVTAGPSLFAIDAAGSAGCGGSPKVCTPRWTADGGSPSGAVQGSPVVANGKVFVGGAAGARAYDATGGTACTGVPKVCQPLWSASSATRPAIGAANGVVYFGTNGPQGGVQAFDAQGSVHCSGVPKVCTSLAYLPTMGSPSGLAISHGWLYVASSLGYVYAFH